MKITEIKIKFDNGGMLDFNYPGGFDLGDIPGALGLSAESFAETEPGTWQHSLNTLTSILFSLAMKRIGL